LPRRIPNQFFVYSAEVVMQTMIRLAMVLAAVLIVVSVASARDSAAVTISPAGLDVVSLESVSLEAASLESAPLLLAQSSDSSSSSGSYRIPRGLVRLAIFAVIALFGAGAWVVRKLKGS
jgi:flagellar biogenesis protein FliO